MTLEMHTDDRWGVEWRCGAYDNCLEKSETFCSLERGHDSRWHEDWRDGKLWAGWGGPHNGGDRQ